MENNKKPTMEKFIGCIFKNYKKTSFVYQASRRIMITRGVNLSVKAFYHFDFDRMSISISFWSKGTWNNSEIKL